MKITGPGDPSRQIQGSADADGAHTTAKATGHDREVKDVIETSRRSGALAEALRASTPAGAMPGTVGGELSSLLALVGSHLEGSQHQDFAADPAFRAFSERFLGLLGFEDDPHHIDDHANGAGPGDRQLGATKMAQVTQPGVSVLDDAPDHMDNHSNGAGHANWVDLSDKIAQVAQPGVSVLDDAPDHMDNHSNGAGHANWVDLSDKIGQVAQPLRENVSQLAQLVREAEQQGDWANTRAFSLLADRVRGLAGQVG